MIYVQVRLELTLPASYPDEVPEMAVKYTHILPKHAAVWQNIIQYNTISKTCMPTRTTHARKPELCVRVAAGAVANVLTCAQTHMRGYKHEI